MINLEVLEERLTDLLVEQSYSADLYVGTRENLTDDHILVDGHLNMVDLSMGVQKIFEKLIKPQIINSPEEADNLPSDVLILTEQGGYWESTRFAGGVYWMEPGGKHTVLSEDLTYPATIIHRGHLMSRPKQDTPRSGLCHECSCHLDPPCWACENCLHMNGEIECPNDCRECEEPHEY